MSDTAAMSITLLDGTGRGQSLPPSDPSSWTPDAGLCWYQMDFSHPTVREELLDKLSLDSLIVEAMLEPETQPRSFKMSDCLYVSLRGLNMNPDADMLDMVSIRIWIEPGRIITAQNLRILAVEDILQNLQMGSGPLDPAGFLIALCDNLSRRMGIVLTSIEDEEDSLESHALEGHDAVLRTTLSHLRRRIITMRRFLAPQRQVLSHLQTEKFSWLDSQDQARLREISDRTIRNVDELDAVRDRAGVFKDELESRHAERINRTMYLLSIVAAIFLPLGLITGLLGINVAGIPGTENNNAFYAVCVFLVIIAGFELWLFKKNKWF